jgi:chemotaxis protein CheX
MFGLEGDSVAKEDMKDSLGELVNMVGGGVKSLLPETCVLSLPTVVEGDDFTISIPGASLVQQAAFQSQGEPVLVTLLEKNAV